MMLNIENVSAYYDESIVLRSVNLEVKSGQVVCLMGRNGVGKTTLLKTIMGLLRPHEGKVLFNGVDITKSTPDKRARAGIGYVLQGREIFPELTVYENLLLGLEACREKEKSIPEEIYSMFPVLKKMLNRRGGDLSGGQQQQLAIARALVARPKLLILDEPTEGIQPSIILDIAKAIKAIREQGDVSILLVEQYLDFVLELADYYYVMEKGEIVVQGLTAEMDAVEVLEHLTF
ncbi:MAG: urea ABC transporter ATP-binding subunit UrtE [Desulfitobacteriaceae bacterium]